MKADKLYGAIGLCMRAGKCIAGDFAVERAVKSGKAKLVMLDNAVSDATLNKYKSICAYAGAEYLIIEALGNAIGKPGIKITAVADEGFKNMIKASIEIKMEKEN